MSNPENFEPTAENEEPKKLETFGKQIGREYDGKKPGLKDKLDESEYNNLKKEHIADKREAMKLRNERDELARANKILAENLEDVNALYEKKIEDYRKLAIDSITGLMRREFLYKEINKYISDKIQFTDKLDAKEISQRIESLAADTDDKTIMMSDISFLSLANKSGHASGDELLERIAKSVADHELKAYRHGGDEITALIDNPETAIPEIVKSIQDKVKEQTDIDNLAQYGLTPNIDIGTAGMQESAMAFQEIYSQANAEGVELPEKPAKYFENLWVDIADKRSFINKGKTRIPLLVEKYKQEQQNQDNSYQGIVDYLRKGGYDITDKEVVSLVSSIDTEDPNDSLVLDFIKQKEEEVIKQQKGLERIKAEAVFKFAWAGEN